MKKLLNPLTFILLIIAFASVVSCQKGSDLEPTLSDSDKPKPTILSDTLKGKWEVSYATHNGTIDEGSKGLRMIFDANGTYLLVNTGYNGTWEFIENKTKILIDKNEPAFKTTWTIKQLTNKNFDITFNSPFTGGAVAWKMVRYKF